MKILINSIVLALSLILIPLLCTAQISPDGSQPVYESAKLIVSRLTPNVYMHTSFFNSETFGKVPCNGMVVTSKNEAIIFDTAADDSSSAELISWVKTKLNHTIIAVIPTHFHADCVGGLKEFDKHKIPSYANNNTIKLARLNHFNVPTNGFDDALMLTVGEKKVYATFFGEGHTTDNIVGYFPADDVMFGGCLVKELGAGKGNLEDANTQEWSETVEKVKQAYPQVKIIIPGHGSTGNKDLLEYTIGLFKK